jgi:hypothetical protein
MAVAWVVAMLESGPAAISAAVRISLAGFRGNRFAYGGRGFGHGVRGYGPVGLGLGFGALAAAGAYGASCGYNYGYYQPYACTPYGYDYY